MKKSTQEESRRPVRLEGPPGPAREHVDGRADHRLWRVGRGARRVVKKKRVFCLFVCFLFLQKKYQKTLVQRKNVFISSCSFFLSYHMHRKERQRKAKKQKKNQIAASHRAAAATAAAAATSTAALALALVAAPRALL